MLKFYDYSICESPQNYIASTIYFVSSLNEDVTQMKIENVNMKKIRPKVEFYTANHFLINAIFETHAQPQ